MENSPQVATKTAIKMQTKATTYWQREINSEEGRGWRQEFGELTEHVLSRLVGGGNLFAEKESVTQSNGAKKKKL